MARCDVPKSLRVAYLTSAFLPTIGGVQLELKWLLDNLDRRLSRQARLDVHLVYPETNPESVGFAQFNNISTHRFPLSGANKLSTLMQIVRLAGRLRAIRPDVIHCYGGILPDGLWAVLAQRLYRLKCKIVVTSHGSDIAWLPHIPYGMRESSRARRVIKWVTGRIDLHVQVSHAMVSHAVDSGTARSKICVIPNGIPLADEYNFEEESALKEVLPSRPLIDMRVEDGIIILCLSSGRAVKNLDGLIEAFALARDELGDSRLLLACTGPQAERIHRLVDAKRLGERVRFIGEVSGSEKQAYFRKSDVYCLPSHFESLGIAALEAMKHQTAVIATDACGVSDFVQHGKNGLLVGSTDVEGMASALVKLHQDRPLRERLAANGLETVKQFSMSRTIEEHVGLYGEIAAEVEENVATGIRRER